MATFGVQTGSKVRYFPNNFKPGSWVRTCTIQPRLDTTDMTQSQHSDIQQLAWPALIQSSHLCHPNCSTCLCSLYHPHQYSTWPISNSGGHQCCFSMGNSSFPKSNSVASFSGRLPPHFLGHILSKVTYTVKKMEQEMAWE